MKNVDTKKNFAKRITVLTILLIALCVGNAWGDETLTINYYSFRDHGTSYTDKTWYATSSPSSNAISGSATVCFTAGQTYIQLKNGHPAFRNTCALPGAIKSIKMTRQSTGSNRQVHIYAGTVALNNSNYSSSGILLNEPTVTTSGVTYNLTSAQISAGYKYFYIFGGSNVLYLDNVVITYASCGGTQLDVPEVTSTPSNGQVQLTWPAVTNATKYQVSWNGGTFTDATSPYTKTSLTNGTSYTWAVKAIGNGSTYCESPAYEGATKPGSTVYTITWKVNGETYATTKVASGDHLVLPASPSSCAVGKEFAGWSATNIGSTPTDTKPTFVSSQTTASATITYYAVFATRTANSYTKGDINDLFPGQTTLIVNVSNNKALSDEYVTSYQDKRLQKVDVTISTDKITSMSNSHVIWTVENRGLKYNFYTGTGYLRATALGNDKLSCNTGADPWTITSANTKTYYMNSNNSAVSRLEYYNSYFTTYGTNGTGAAYEMSFFVPTYTQYFTSCASCSGDPTIGDPTIPTSFTLTSLTGAVSVNGSVSPGSNCTWEDMGLVWGASANPTTSNNKKVIGGSGSSISNFANNVQPTLIILVF